MQLEQVKVLRIVQTMMESVAVMMDTKEIDVILANLVGIGLKRPVIVQVCIPKSIRFLTLSIYLFLLGCDCNWVGTIDNASTCADETGECTCDSSLGYTGTKCDMCLDGWLLKDDGTCRSTFIFTM